MIEVIILSCMEVLYKSGGETVTEPYRDIKSVKAVQEERMVKDTFLDDGYRSQQEPEIGKRRMEKHTEGSGQKS